MKDGLFVLTVVCTKLLEMKGEIVYIPLSVLFISNYLCTGFGAAWQLAAQQ